MTEQIFTYVMCMALGLLIIFCIGNSGGPHAQA